MRHLTAWLVALVVAALGAFPRPCAAATAGPALSSILTAMAGGGDLARAGLVVAAINTSPRLIDQLNDLAALGLLKSLTIGPRGAGGSAGSHQNGVITLTPLFIDNQTPAGGGDEALRRTIGSRDLVFVLGYLASKLRSAPAHTKMMDDLKALVRATPKGQSFDATQVLAHNMEFDLRDEARAYLEGWNDEMDAATAAKGALLNPPETFALLRNSRNTRPILEAALLPAAERLVPIGTLQFPPNEHNLKALAGVLARTRLPDFH